MNEHGRMRLEPGFYNSFETVIEALEIGGKQAQSAGFIAHGACLLHAATELKHVWEDRQHDTPAPQPHLLSGEKLLESAEARQDCLFGRHASKDQTAFIRNRDRVELYFLANFQVLASDLADRQFSDLDSCLQVVELLAIDVVDLGISREQIEKIKRHQILPRVIEAENVLCEREFLTEAYTPPPQARTPLDQLHDLPCLINPEPESPLTQVEE